MKKLVLLFCCLLCVGFGGRAMAAEAPNDRVLETTGVITAIDNNQLTIKGEGNYPEIVLNVEHDTYLNCGLKGKSLKIAKFAVGDKVSAYYGQRVTRSIPPQGQAVAIVKLAEGDMTNGRYIKVAEVTAGDKYVSVLNSNGDLIAKIDKKACRKYKKIQAGDELLVWYDMVAMSMPGQTNANKAVILDHKCDGTCNR